MALSLVISETDLQLRSLNNIRNRLNLIDIGVISELGILSEGGTSSTTSSGYRSHASPTETSNSVAEEFDSIDEILENQKSSLRVMHNERNILNLGANIREPNWHPWSPSEPVFDVEGKKTQNSVYFRLKGEEVFTEDYPMRKCQCCGFLEPSPLNFNSKRISGNNSKTTKISSHLLSDEERQPTYIDLITFKNFILKELEY